MLGHELTHVAQNKNKRFESKDELEREAELAEYIETAESDPPENVTIAGIDYPLRKEEQKEIVYMTADSITKWVEERKYILDEKKYFKLLIKYKEMVTGSGAIL